jgi:asparagine synthase (glutamine-hydrolysing)
LFIFASEVKGILHILKRLNKVIEVDKNQLNLFYCLGYIPSPLTLYKNVFKLPLRSSLEYDLVSHTKQINSFQTLIQPAAGLGEFQTLLEKKIIDHLIADVPVGVLFSGGTDSSVIASVLKKNNIRLENFSIQMSHKKEDEKFFKAISQYLDIKSHVYEFGQHEFEEVYPQVMSRLDEPFADGSIFPTFYISQKAAEKVKVVLGGDGGDEYFYGYPRDRVLYPYNERPDYEMTWLDKLYFIIPQLPFKNAVFKRLFRLARQPLSYYLANASLGKDLVPWQRCKEEMRRRQLKPLDLDKLWNLENISLRKTDLATSYNSIEGRVPLLDIDVIVNSDQFEKIKLSGGCLKYLLKKILLSYLPHKFVFRGKSGFGANLKVKFHHSPQLQQDLARAIEFLKSRDLLPPGFKIKKQGWYAKRYPNFCFSLIVLYYNLQYAE